MFSPLPIGEFHTCVNTGTDSGLSAPLCTTTSLGINRLVESDENSFSVWVKPTENCSIIGEQLYYTNGLLNIDNSLVITDKWSHFVATKNGDIYLDLVKIGQWVNGGEYAMLVENVAEWKEMYIFNYEISYNSIVNLYLKDQNNPRYYYPLYSDFKDYSHSASADLIHGVHTFEDSSVRLDTTSGGLTLPIAIPFKTTSQPVTIRFKFKNDIRILPGYYPSLIGTNSDSSILIGYTYGSEYYNDNGETPSSTDYQRIETYCCGNSNGWQYNTLNKPFEYWYDILISKNGPLIKYYVDGVLMYTWNHSECESDYGNTTTLNYIGRSIAGGDIRTGHYKEVGIYQAILTPQDFIDNNFVIGRSLVSFKPDYYSALQQCQALYQQFLDLETPVGVTDTEYLEAEDVMPLFSDREVIYGN